MIPFNKLSLVGRELELIKDAVRSKWVSGDGSFTKKCQKFFESRYKFLKTFLTTSCTDALEMSALLCDIKPGDEVIIPSYTFVSTANAFVLRGAKIIFCDSRPDMPHIDEKKIEGLIGPKTKAIVPMHYGGIACDMAPIVSAARRHHLFVIEDAAQAIESFYKQKPLGSLGDLGTFSFHETKNISCGEGGMLVVNDPALIRRAEIIREKGTDRSAFFRGEVDKYGWVDIGSSFLPSDILASFLYAQIEKLDAIILKRVALLQRYHKNLEDIEKIGILKRPLIPKYATNNGHLFYVLCENAKRRASLIEFLKKYKIHAIFHYLSLHQSRYFRDQHDGRRLSNSDRYADTLLRLPLYYDLSLKDVDKVCETIRTWAVRV